METKYHVSLFMDSTYEVWHYMDDAEYIPHTDFQGSLADCESWIRLHENGYMD